MLTKKAALSFIQLHLFWVLLLAWLVSLLLAASQLRQNNLRMVELRDRVTKVDQDTGDIKKIEPALYELRDYILTHMNTDMAGPLELPGTYNKAVSKAREGAAKANTATGEIYRRAQVSCERPEVPLTVRAQCIQEFVLSHTPRGTTTAELKLPPKEQYIYNFASPRWSPDGAGFSVLLSLGLLTGALAVGLVRYAWPRLRDVVADDPLE